LEFLVECKLVYESYEAMSVEASALWVRRRPACFLCERCASEIKQAGRLRTQRAGRYRSRFCN